MTKLLIEKNIPIPPRKKSWEFLNELEIGDSVLFTWEEENFAKERQKLSVVLARFAKTNPPFKAITRRIDKTSFRVWRVS